MEGQKVPVPLCLDYVCPVIKDDMQKEEFLRDETLKRAVTRRISILAEFATQ